MEQQEIQKVADKLGVKQEDIFIYEIPPENLKLLPDNFKVLVYDGLTERISLKTAKSFKAGYDRFLHYLIFNLPRLKELKE